MPHYKIIPRIHRYDSCTDECHNTAHSSDNSDVADDCCYDTLCVTIANKDIDAVPECVQNALETMRPLGFLKFVVIYRDKQNYCTVVLLDHREPVLVADVPYRESSQSIDDVVLYLSRTFLKIDEEHKEYLTFI